MCGIFAAVSNKPVAGMLVQGLKRLEYRGYDSAGVVTVGEDGMRRVCAVGKVAALEQRLSDGAPRGHAGIAHTRWATHGAPSEVNSHPHVANGIAVVHNGIIENHAEMRSQLQQQGCMFKSKTDTEVIPWLLSRSVGSGSSPTRAIQDLGDKLSGSYAIAVVTDGDPDVIYAKRFGSPLVAALGADGGYLSSDIVALSGLAEEAVVLDDGDQVEVRFDRISVFDKDGRPVTRPKASVDMGEEVDGKAGYPHYMLKEINEQPAVARTIAEQYDVEKLIDAQVGVDFAHVDRLRLIACGTSYYACMTAKRWFAEVAGLSAEVELASEHRYAPVVGDGLREIAILVSQSGETADTLASLGKLKGLRIPTIGIVNQQASTLAREADYFLPLLAGPEIGVASTQAFTAQLLVLARLAAHAAGQRGHRAAAKRFQDDLARTPALISAVLHNEAAIIEIADLFGDARAPSSLAAATCIRLRWKARSS